MTTATKRQNVLLCVIGLTPPVVTETIYALTQTRRDPWYPSRILAITTQAGRETAEKALFDDHKFDDLRRTYPDIPPIAFAPDDLRVIESDGRPINDIRSVRDSAATADFIMDQVREITDDPDTELHVSLAGGRKTMSFLAGYALSLFGRDQDRLSHVLVSEPFESCRQFFFPTREKQMLTIKGEKEPADARNAKITLADIPFVRLEKLVSLRTLARMIDYRTLCRALEEKAHLTVDLLHGKLVFSRSLELDCLHGRRDATPKFEPLPAALYACFAHRAAHGQPFIAIDELLTDQAVLLKFYDCFSNRGDTGVAKKKSDLESAKSKANAVLTDFLKELADSYSIATEGRKPTRFGLRLDPAQIEFIAE